MLYHYRVTQEAIIDLSGSSVLSLIVKKWTRIDAGVDGRLSSTIIYGEIALVAELAYAAG